MRKKLLLIVPQKGNKYNQNPGGQITAVNGLIEYVSNNGIAYNIINTASPSFPSPNLLKKIIKSVGRVFTSAYYLLFENIGYCILFTGGGLSLLERLIICLLCRVFGVSCLLFFRNSTILKIKKNTILGIIFKYSMKIPNKIAVQGQMWKKHYISMGIISQKIKVIRNWIPPFFKIVVEPKCVGMGDIIHFVFVGWLVEEKGPRQIVEAAIKLKEKYRFKITIVGDGNIKNELQELIIVRELNEIILTGWLEPVEVDEILESSHVFVLPTYHLEGFPNALLEAMAKGLPAITTRMGAIQESIRNGVNGYLIPPRDSCSLAKAMEKYICNKKLITEHSRLTLEIVKINHNRERNCSIIFDKITKSKLEM